MLDINETLQTNLTPEQLGAATDTTRAILTLACAGSGKSRTLAFRIAFLLANGAAPEGIVAFTFTEKAAESIKRNVAKALTQAGIPPTLLGAMFIGTIHSYCQHVLGTMDARYRQFDVLDTNRLILFLISRYPQLGLHVLKQQRNARYFETIREVASAWSIANDEMVSLDAVFQLDEALGHVLLGLRQRLDEEEYIDFSLMIRLVVDGLHREDPGALASAARIQHLMVDEYQDVNTAQERLICALHRHSESLFVVGDDDQSIYGWRGADVNNILGFVGRNPGSAEHTLGHNFRSTPAIVSAADALAAAELGAQRIAKLPRATEPPGPRDFRVLWFATRLEEANWVADRIQALLGARYVEGDGSIRGLTPGDFAILMRSTRQNEQAGSPRHTAFTTALRDRNISFSLEAGGSPFEVPQVEALRQTFEMLRERTPTREEARAHLDSLILGIYPYASFPRFAQVLSQWGREIHTPAGGARRRVFPQTLLYDLLWAFGVEQSQFPDSVMRAIGVFSKVLQDAEAVYVSIDSDRRFAELLNFLQNVGDSGYDLTSDDVVRAPDAVTVSTVHKMKGLEFPVVFVVDVEDGRFPKSRSSYSGWLPAALIQEALGRGCYASTPNEEARLFYTAVTRGERFLYVSGAQQLPGARRARTRSRYARQLFHPEISDDPNILPLGLERHPPMPRLSDSSLPTSFSDVRYYLRCPKDYQFRHRFGFAPAIVEMFGFGQTVHASVGKLHEQFRDVAPTPAEAEAIARAVFYLKHIPRSGDPVNRPGGYERAQDSAGRIVKTYAESYHDDFNHRREVEARFEIFVERAVISGSIDLLIREDEEGHAVDASVIDFKAMQGGDAPEENERLNWTELSLQVQLYAKAAREVLGENARTGAVHLLKDNQRILVPVGDAAVENALSNVTWAVDSILAGDFPMCPHPEKCSACDFQKICSKRHENFRDDVRPPAISIPGGTTEMIRSFSQLQH